MADTSTNVVYTNRRIKETTAGMWQDFYDEGRPFSKVSMYFNDFHSWVADAWTVTEAGTCKQTIADERNGVLVLTAQASENTGSNLQLGGTGDVETTGESWAPSAGKNLWFECRIASNDADQNDIFVGLHVEDTSVVASRGTDYIGFRVDDEDANIDVEACASSAASSDVAVATLSDGAYKILGFKVTGTEKIEFYVDGVLVSTLTNVPTGLMKLTISHLTGEATANTLSVDYVAIAQDR